MNPINYGRPRQHGLSSLMPLFSAIAAWSLTAPITLASLAGEIAGTISSAPAIRSVPDASPPSSSIEAPNATVLLDRMPALLSSATSEPPLRFARFSRTKGDYDVENLLRDPAHLTNWGVSRYEGAIQDAGFYLKHLTNSPLIPGAMRPGEELILGENRDQFWQMEAGHHVLGVSPKRSNTHPAAGRKLICLLSKYLIHELRCLGVNELAGFNLVFPDPLHFAGTNSAGDKAFGTLFVTNNSAAALSYTIASSPQDVYEVRYQFSGGEFPSRINKRMKRGVVQGQDIDLAVEQLDYGMDPKASKGYFALDFRTKPQPLATLVLYTNNLRFIVNPDGTLAGMDGYQRPAPVSAQVGDLSLFFVILFVGLTGFCLVQLADKAGSATVNNKATG